MKRKTILTEQDLNTIQDIYKNAECYTKLEVSEMLLEQFESEDLEDELLQNGVCIQCFEKELETQIEYTDDMGDHYCYQCNVCDFIKTNTWK